MNNLTEPSVSEENKIEEISTNLFRRVERETEKLLVKQLKGLGVVVRALIDLDEKGTDSDLKKQIFPDDPQALAIYEYKGQKILGLRISDNGMAIEFDIPDPLAMGQIEAQINIAEKQKCAHVPSHTGPGEVVCAKCGEPCSFKPTNKDQETQKESEVQNEAV